MRLLRDEGGQALVLAAVFMGVLALGFMALAVDMGTLFREKRMAQSAADAVAVAAAAEIAAGNSATQEASVAASVAKLNGFDTTAAVNPASVTLSTPGSGTFHGSGTVQATVSAPIHTLFLAAFSSRFNSVSVAANAIAGGNASQTCVCLEGRSGETLNLSNNAKLTAPGCGVVVNSDSSNAVGIVGSAALSAYTLGTVATGWDNTSNINNAGTINSSTIIVQGISSGCTPAMPSPPSYSNCLSDPGGSYLSFTAGPATPGGTVCYQSLTIGSNGSLPTLNPGVYVISSGTLHFESGSGGKSNLGGNGVFFYLGNTASLVIDNGANVNIVAGGGTLSGGGTAPSLGAYDGIAFYQDSCDTKSVSLQGGSSTYINGALFAPGAAVTIGNGSGATQSGGIVAQSLTMNGGGTMTASIGANQGSLAIGSAKLLQ